MSDKMWNGGKTNSNYILRSLEDRYDIDDSEIEFREELVEREKLMRSETPIESKYKLTREKENEDTNK